jgi:AcrR family transcriptional regulator
MGTKDKIISASLDLFLEKGYHASSMRDIAEKAGVVPGGLYNHFKEKEEIYQAVLNKFHPWLLIPKLVRTAKGENFDAFVRDISKKEQKELKKHEKFLKLHFIELVEFNGSHLPVIFEMAFNEMVTELSDMAERRPHIFEDRSIPQLSRALLGLFFSFMINDQLIIGSNEIQTTLKDFGYLNDIYLQGIISSLDKSTKKD